MVIKKKTILSWCLFDFGQTAFSTVIVTFVFSAYFAKMVATNETIGISDFGFALSISGIFIAILSPFIGAIRDGCKSKKPWIVSFTFLSCIAVASLFLVKPEPSFALLALALFAVANTLVEINQVFYNAYLPEISPSKKIGKISGYGWGSGYLGGLIALILVFAVCVKADIFSHKEAFNIRMSAPFVASWMFLFSLPLIFLIKDSSFVWKKRGGIKALFETLSKIKKHAVIFRFLLARLIYMDGMNTVLTLGAVFASIVFNMTFEQLLYFGIAMNLIAGLGAFLLARLGDKIGNLRLIVLCLVAILITGFFILTTRYLIVFWIASLIMALFIGPLQAGSRALMAHLAPKEMRGEMFGLYALSGKVTSFVGPLLVGIVTRSFNSERLGMATLFGLIGLGLILILPLMKKKI
jgi:UMF1 family MFS transporter